ncbi:MAG TPA: 50S ribosomal protein L29 [Chthoniobacteraceae bacterium]|jgi:large subunit ribosomal protein L29|nr:50S ribosomal protein L29 [Chthoniobacteraceae bacterium]
MNIKQVRELSRTELATRRLELEKERFHLRVQQQSGQLEKPSELRAIRRDIARIASVLAAPSAAVPSK